MAPPPQPAPFSKPWLSYQDQVALLQQRGLAVADPGAAAQFLSHVNYYRFSGYCLAFEQTRHCFHPTATFEQIRAAYELDRVLRDLVTEALEEVELDLRTTIAHHFGRQHGPLGHTQPTAFFHTFKHQTWLAKLRDEASRSRGLFVIHFNRNYQEFPDLPIWMATEVMSFGVLSWMFSGMTRADQGTVVSRYGRQPRDLESWMHHLVYVCNLCAHHARLWDRVWSIKPRLPAGNAWQPPLLPGNDRLFVTLLILSSMLRKCPALSAFRNQWRGRVQDLLDHPPDAPSARDLMGLTADWKNHLSWQ